MSIIETITDVNNTFLSRRELTCNFAGLGGKLKKLEAIDMISKEFKLDGKVIVPMRLQSHVGKTNVTGTFFIYEDENLAKKQVNPTIFSRLEKSKAKLAEAETAEKEAESKEETPTEDKEVKAEETSEKEAESKEETPTEDKEVKAEETPKEEKKEETSE